MTTAQASKKKKGSSGFAIGFLSFATLTVVGAGVMVAPMLKKQAHLIGADLSPSRIWQIYGEAFINLQNKVDDVRMAQQTSDRLQLENSNLRLRIETMAFQCQTTGGAKTTKEIEAKLMTETGSKIGRTLAGIPYQVPTHLEPTQLFTVAINQFQNHEDEKAVKVLSFLAGMDDSDAYKNARTYLMLGVAWYRLDNMGLAEANFNNVIKAPNTPVNLPFQAQARLWKGIVAEKMGKHLKAQSYLKDLIDYHPHARESAWVNSTEANREPTSTEE